MVQSNTYEPAPPEAADENAKDFPKSAAPTLGVGTVTVGSLSTITETAAVFERPEASWTTEAI